MSDSERIAKIIKINGIVQGVGFRPFVYQLAKQYGITGDISNTSSGVLIHAEGFPNTIDQFCKDIIHKSPPLAQITDVSESSSFVTGVSTFHIANSTHQGSVNTLISPDAAICNDCIKELFTPSDRRYLYPFINCTNCGPRYTIISDIPYDRPYTSMKHFQMCPECQKEYDDPNNRRFHAQPNACPVCGPQVTLWDNQRKMINTASPIQKASELLQNGFIVAVKGLGGFHLAVDPYQHESVVQLRKRKHREEKPFAMMAATIDSICQFAIIDPQEIFILQSVQRPIVLVKKKEPNKISDAVSPMNKYYGVMLPYTPLHYLLFHYGLQVLVMTSGNISSEPIAIDNSEAFDRLGTIADFFLVHNRDIYIRSDDSIVRNIAGQMRMIRRSRGFVPIPIFLNQSMPQILACGAELKNTICLTKENKAFVSQHIGDMENVAAYDFFVQTIDHMKRILDICPQIIACDLHPDYMSSRYAMEQTNRPIVKVQHHHAHVASCMAEHRIDGPVIGLAFDGTGYGSDGHIWGGEVLIAETHKFMRISHLEYIPMPGSASAIKSPWRMGISYLYHAFGENIFDLKIPLMIHIAHQKIDTVVQMIKKNINSPLTSSLGRLFDGIAAILGIRYEVTFEGQAAMELEMTADITDDIYPYDIDSFTQIDTISIIRSMVDDLQKGVSISEISGKFHKTVIAIFVDVCTQIRNQTGINQVVLSGGVFQNSILLEGFINLLEKNKFEVYSHRLVPTNDGGISLGQAVVAGILANA